MWIQVQEFFFAVLIGLALAVILHFHQMNVKHLPRRNFWLWLLDLMVWLLVIPLVFAGLLIINQGEVRYYVLLALAVGGILYLVYLKPRLERPLASAAAVTAGIARSAWSVMARPWRLIRARLNPPIPPEGEDQ